MISRENAYKLLNQHIQNANMIKHSVASEGCAACYCPKNWIMIRKSGGLPDYSTILMLRLRMPIRFKTWSACCRNARWFTFCGSH